MDHPLPHHDGGARPEQPLAKRKLHHNAFFWIAAFFILVAMIVYVMTDNLAFRPGKPAQKPMPALAP